MIKKQKFITINTPRILIILAVIIIAIYIVLRSTVLSTAPGFSLLYSIFKPYLQIPEWFANILFNASNAGVKIVDHNLCFERLSGYHAVYHKFIENWPEFLIYSRWSILLIVLIWGTLSSISKKLIFSSVFLFTHLVSVTGGLYWIGFLLPNLIKDQTRYSLSPTLVGTVTMFILLTIWTLLNKKEINLTLQKLKAKNELSNKKFIEILTALFFLLLLREYFIPYFDFRPYRNLLLVLTRMVVSLFGYSSYIQGDGLVGTNGIISLSKHCLGLMTMYIFSSVVYLTRPNQNNRMSLLYIFSGLIFLIIMNIVRLSILFFIVQGENGAEKAATHHEIYNAIIYALVFILWVIWYEFFVLKIKKQINAKI